MGAAQGARCYEPSQALAERSPPWLRAELAIYLAEAERGVAVDPRDVIVGLASFHDCAQRLGIDPVALFDEASEAVSVATQELARSFGRRTDVVLTSFGWTLTTTSEGPCYRPDDLPFVSDLAAWLERDADT